MGKFASKHLARFAILLVALLSVSPVASWPVVPTTSFSNLPGGVSVASWAITNAAGTSIARYFAVDNENGNDARSCYVDAAVGTVFTTELTAVACKTFERIREILPRFGAGRTAVILAKPRSDNGNFKKKDVTTNDNLDIGYTNYKYLAFRGSDLTNSTNDKIDLGGVNDSTAVGPGGGGEWTVSGAMAGFTVTVSAGTLATQDQIGGLKLKFNGNVTAGARTVGSMAIKRASATTFDISRNMTLAANDTFYFQRPGVKVASIEGIHLGVNGPIDSGSIQRTTVLAGFEFTGAVVLSATGPIVPMFVRFSSGVTVGGGTWWGPSSLYKDEAATSRTILCSMDARSDVSITNVTSQSVSSSPSVLFSYFHGPTFKFNRVNGGRDFIIGSGCGFAIAPSIIASTDYLIKDTDTNNVGVFGGTNASDRQAYVLAGATLRGDFNVARVDMAGSSAPLSFYGTGMRGHIESVIGAVTAGVNILDFTNANNSTYTLDTSGITATTSGGGVEILMGNSVSATFASLATSPQYDEIGNRVTGSGINPVKKTVLKFSGEHVGAAGAVISYMADTGKVAAGALVTAIGYPMPASRARNLRIKCAVNALAANMTATVYKNGSATAIIATVTTGATTVFTDTTHEAQFAASDLFDLRLDSTGGGVNTAECSATLEVF